MESVLNEVKQVKDLPKGRGHCQTNKGFGFVRIYFCRPKHNGHKTLNGNNGDLFILETNT